MISVSQGAEMLGVSSARVRKLIAEGALPAVKVGGLWAIDERDVANRLASSPRAGRPGKSRAASGGARPATEGEPGSFPAERELYRSCKEMFRFRPHPQLVANAESSEEASFYLAVSDFFLQQKQREVVRRGVF